jgi:thiamine biosynthesis protein ThiI
MLFIIKFAPEIITKSKPVRQQMANRLYKNINAQCKAHHFHANIKLHWDKLTLSIGDDKNINKSSVIQVLKHTSGIAHFLDVLQTPFTDFDDATNFCLEYFEERIQGKTFVVRCKRSGQHEFTSHDLERQVGGRINQRIENTQVKLKNPDVTIGLELNGNTLFLIKEKIKGLGGFPMGEVEPVLSLISGGFDSSVSSYMTMRRGMPTHFCFFNLGGSAHEIAVKEVAYYLHSHFGSGVRVNFISVPFEPIVAEILDKITNSQMGVVLKRMMYRAASQIAERQKIQALVTGEAVAQVSSQTLTNLSVIEKVTDTLILRPLITSDKEDIIGIAREIGTEAFSAVIPEYCGVISDRPTTRAKLDIIEGEEKKFDLSLIDQVVQTAKITPIDKIGLTEESKPQHIETVDSPTDTDVIIDIRHPDDILDAPLTIADGEIEIIPFYKLNQYFETQDSGKRYLLFCDQGVMSKLHASHLMEKGFNVGVFLKKP